MSLSSSLIVELESVQEGPSEKRAATLRRVTDLFLSRAEEFSEAQVGLFDSVLLRLIERVEIKVLAELSSRLAPAPNAPPGVIRHLAHHDDILVAGPVLAQSERLKSADLIEIARTKGEAHLLAISSRALLDETVTEVLLDRGSREVFRKLAENYGAFFSKEGFKLLVNFAKSDEALAEKVGQRLDVPPHLVEELVLKATDSVRARLLATAPAPMHADIKRVLATISNEVVAEVRADIRDLNRARESVLAMHQKNQLNETRLGDFAKLRKYEELVVALALMCSARTELIERLMQSGHTGGLLVACKAADLKWATVQDILTHRIAHRALAKLDLEQAMADYGKLTKATAQKLLEFWQARTGLRV
jgi:uncharacterized protein (DUF2336 family)